jgi:hypothetical protein
MRLKKLMRSYREMFRTEEYQCKLFWFDCPFRNKKLPFSRWMLREAEHSASPKIFSNSVPNLRRYSRLCAMLCCLARSHDSPLCNNALSRLRAMQHSAEFLLKIFSIEIMLYCIARSRRQFLERKTPQHSTESWLHAMLHSAELNFRQFTAEYLREFETEFEKILGS